MSTQQTFTRKEVLSLLKRQREACLNSYIKMPCTEEEKQHLFFGFRDVGNAYWNVVKRVKARLANVSIIKF